MIIAIPVKENNNKTQINNTFGRSPYFLFYNSQTKEESYLKNPGETSQGGAGIKTAQLIIDQGSEVLLTPRCGEKAYNALMEANVKIYETKTEDVFKNINDFLEDKLQKLISE